jgi:hypothetical protein
MTVGSQEHDDLIAQFERDYRITERRAEKEPRRLWAQGNVYSHGETNAVFDAYRKGYAFARCVYLQHA